MLKPVLGSQLNLGSHLTRGLVGLWLMNEGSGNKVFDLSGNNNTGTLVADTHFVPGKFGSAIDIVGTDGSDYISFGNPESLQITEAITVLVWCKTSQTGTKYIIGKDDSTLRSYRLILDGNEQARFDVVIGNILKFGIHTQKLINDGVYHQVVGTYDGSIVKAYVDGVVGATTTSTSGSIDNDLVDFEIGRRQDGTRSWGDEIDHVIIWNRALLQNEIALLYQAMFQI